MGIDKFLNQANGLINNVNRAVNTVDSIKGLISSFSGKNYTSIVDRLGEQADEAKRILEQRRATLRANLDSQNQAKTAAKVTPISGYDFLMYPIYDTLDNYIIFSTDHGSDGFEDSDTFVNFSNANQKLDIALYVPDNLSSEVTTSYTQAETGETAAEIIGAISGEQSGIIESIKEIVVSQGLQILRSTSGQTGAEAARRAGIAINPVLNQFFEGVPFRNFTFEFEFNPKSEKEAEQVNKIIYGFRKSMLPGLNDITKDGGVVGGIFKYPNRFNIRLEGPIKDKVDGYLPSYLSNMSVNHTGGQKFSVFRDGQPVRSTMSLQFIETEILTFENYTNKIAAGDFQPSRSGLSR